MQAFIERNHNGRFTPDLDQRLIGRDQELTDVCHAIQHNQAVLLSGTSGCGKTKLALEACRTMAAADNAEFYVVTPTRQDIYEDLRIFLPGNRLTYLLLDDANQLAGLRTAVDYALDKPNIKLVVTRVFEQANAILDRLGMAELLRDAGLDGLELKIIDSFDIRSDEDPVLVAESWQSAVASVLGLS